MYIKYVRTINLRHGGGLERVAKKLPLQSARDIACVRGEAKQLEGVGTFVSNAGRGEAPLPFIHI